MGLEGSAAPSTSAATITAKPVGFNEETLQRLRVQINAQQVAAANQALPLPESMADFKLPGLTEGFDTVQTLLDLARRPDNGNPAFGGLDVKVAEAHRRMVPSRVPLGVNMEALAQERERILRARIADRVNGLTESLNSMQIEEGDNDEARLKQLVQLKMLKLRDSQRKLRESVLRVSQQSLALDLASERGSGYRRPKKQSLKEMRNLERYERQQRLDRSRKERQTYYDYLAAVNQATKDWQAAQRNNQQRRAKLVRQVLQHHSQFEREEQRRVERVAKERLRALKADDEEAYLKLLDQQKDTRLTHLIKQTDEFLVDLSAKVVAQQNDPLHMADGSVAMEESVPDTKGDYYHTAHRIKETVTAQSSLLTGGKLKEYQVKGLQWMLSLYNNHLNGILADEMGLGKTIQTISLIAHLMEQKAQTGPYLIIVPLSTMNNWALEFEKWAPSIVKVEYKGVPGTRKALQAQLRHAKFNVLLTTYEYIIKDRPFLSKIKWLYMIIDEGHRMKNAHSKLTLVLTQYYSARFRLILTGTPLQNNLPELWALLNFVLPHIFNSCKSFEDWFNAPFANTGEKVELNEEETLLIIRRLHKVLRPFLLRRLKKDVEGELPEKVEIVLKCPMSALQLRLYTMVKQQQQSSEATAAVGLKRLNNTIMQLRKICNHPFVFEEVERQVNPVGFNNDLLHRVSGKFELLHRILPKFKAADHRILIFFQMTQVMTIMEDFLNMAGYKYLRLDGSTKAEDRSELLQRFNAPNSPYFIFLLSTRAGGLGLNLQTADTVIIFDSDWNPHQDLQAQDRAHRIGQTKEVRILRLVTIDSVEEYILERAQFKLNLDGKVIQAGKFDQKSTNEEREAMLRAIFEGEQEKGDQEDVYNDDELAEMIARNEAELELYRRMDAEARPSAKARLIEESELPSVYLESVTTVADDEPASSGPAVRAARKKEISYSETMSDERWLAQLEAGSDAEGGAVKSGRGRKRKTADIADGAAASPVARALKLTITTTNSANEVKDGLDDATRLKIMQQVYDDVDNCLDESGHRYRSEIFQELPSRSQYPDYYQLIKAPIAMAQIQAALPSYGSIAAFQAAWDRLFSNAQAYNREGSQVYEDATVLKQLVRDRLEALMESVGAFGGASAEGSDNVSEPEDEDDEAGDEDGDEDEEEESYEPSDNE